MWKGALTGIYIAPDAGAPLVHQNQVNAVPDRGLEGDRYFDAKGSFSRWPGPHRAVTLIAEEDLARIKEESGIDITAAQSRRNLLTSGVPLRALLKKKFRVGTVEMEGMRICQPCKYLARLLEEPDLVQAMVHKGGLRARILTEGIITLHDTIEPLDL